MVQPQKHVVFDVVGTCVSFDAYYDRIDKVLGAKLKQHNVTAHHFGYTWQTAAELEFTFLSISGRYKPYRDVMRGVFFRTLALSGVKNPKEIATDAERDECMEGYASLELRPDTMETFKLLRDNGFTVWCFTTGDVARVRGYFERAGMSHPLENFISCDGLGVAKPTPAAYEHVYKKLGEKDIKWFAAAHMWDVTAATKVGFRGAWSSALELEPCLDVFDDTTLDVVAGPLLEMAQQIVDKSR